MFSVGYSFDEISIELKKQKCGGWIEAWNETKYLFNSKECGGFAKKVIMEFKGKEYDYFFVHLRDEFKFTDRHHAILSHELIHICTFQLSCLIDIVKENKAFAYTHTHLLEQCYQILRKKKPR